MNIKEATKRACEEETLLDALTFICIWEAERAVNQVIEAERTGLSTAIYGNYDTCFKFCLKSIMDSYGKQNSDAIAKPTNREG